MLDLENRRNDFYEYLPGNGLTKKGGIQAVTFEKTDKEYVVGKFNKSKTLAKMLSCYFDSVKELDSRRFHYELDELKHQEVIRASSTSLLVPGKACDLYRHIGLLLDSDRCDVRHICPYDAAATRTTADSEDIRWDTERKIYTTWSPIRRRVVEFHGHFNAYGEKLETIDELLKAYNNPSPKMIVEDGDGILRFNEVVVDWNKDSIIGIVGTKCAIYGSHLKPSSISDSKLKSDCLLLQGELEKQLSVSVPVFLYDHLKGDLKLFSET